MILTEGVNRPMEKNKKESAFLEKWKAFTAKVRSVTDPVGRVLSKIGNVLFHLRKVFLTVPVVLIAMRVFLYAKENLPAEVGILLQETGEYKYMLDRNTAMTCCLALTGACLLLMFMSRRTVYPWIISLFSLVLPLFLIVSNMFPA